MGSKKIIKKDTKEVKIKKVADPKVEVATAPVVESDSAEKTVETTEVNKVPSKKAPSKQKRRGQRYQAVRSKIDKSKSYEPSQAVALVKKLSYSNFVGSLEVHLIVREIGMSVDLSLPHSTGKKVRVAIVDKDLLDQIEAGKLDFDVLISHPEFMPKLAKYARVLGPKGLMPNPKSGTLTPNPELKKKELEGGKFTLKTEKKAPLMHLSIGKLDMTDKDLVENLETVIKALGNRLLKLSIAASMSPSVKVSFQIES